MGAFTLRARCSFGRLWRFRTLAKADQQELAHEALGFQGLGKRELRPWHAEYIDFQELVTNIFDENRWICPWHKTPRGKQISHICIYTIFAVEVSIFFHYPHLTSQFLHQTCETIAVASSMLRCLWQSPRL